MDVTVDEKFKKELLARLDKIIALLSISCAISNGSIEKAKAESAIRQLVSSRQPENVEAANASVSMDDEMDEIYSLALRRWRQEHDDKPSVSNQ